jgi:hypothetical protein
VDNVVFDCVDLVLLDDSVVGNFVEELELDNVVFGTVTDDAEPIIIDLD